MHTRLYRTVPGQIMNSCPQAGHIGHCSSIHGLPGLAVVGGVWRQRSEIWYAYTCGSYVSNKRTQSAAVRSAVQVCEAIDQRWGDADCPRRGPINYYTASAGVLPPYEGEQ